MNTKHNKKTKEKVLLMVANVDWFFISHRICIAQKAVEEGWKVIVAAKDTGRSFEIKDCGIEFINFKFSRSGTNPINELKTLRSFYQLYKKINPDIVHHITLKPVIYGSIIAKVLKVNAIVNAIGGLGYSFADNRKGIIQKLMLKLMKFGFARDNLTIIFQNTEDQSELETLGVVDKRNNIIRIKGSGVDLKLFAESTFPDFSTIKILFPVRMLWYKGVKELREASDILKDKYKHKIKFILAGLVDEENKDSIPISYLNDWQDDDYVRWIGYQKNMVKVFQDAHIVVLPSFYREGVPKSLIEACAIGRPIITTDNIGCKECVEEGVNGYKIAVKSSEQLAEAISKLVENTDDIKAMGRASRIKAEKEFDVIDVINKHLEIYNSLLENRVR